MKRIKILACETLKKEVTKVIQDIDSVCPVHFIPARLHASPAKLHWYIQDQIDQASDVDEIRICVSGCGGSTIGLKATTANLIIPRTNDCIDLLLSTDDIASLIRPQNRRRLSLATVMMILFI